MRVTKEEIVQRLIVKLWNSYMQRVSYARIYADLVGKKKGQLVFDHLAFRTINAHTGEQPEGILGISHIFETLGYRKEGEYYFRKKNLKAIHLEIDEGILPRIFISELEVEKLPEWAQQILRQAVKDTPYLISDHGIELLSQLRKDGNLTAESGQVLIDELTDYFKRPWAIPAKHDVLKLNDISHYAAWALLYGNSVEHFAASINHQKLDEWPGLEETCEGLKAVGIPMKETIEGEKVSKLRQSATLAAKEEVEVKTTDGIDKILWAYSYFELTKRNSDGSDETGEKLFSGFIGKQTRHLFDLTVTHDN